MLLSAVRDEFAFHCECRKLVNANLKMSVFAEKECHFSPDSIRVYTALTTTSLVGLKPVKP